MITLRQISKAAAEALADLGIAGAVSVSVEGDVLQFDIAPKPSKADMRRFAELMERRHRLLGADVWVWR